MRKQKSVSSETFGSPIDDTNAMLMREKNESNSLDMRF